jgi:peptidase E
MTAERHCIALGGLIGDENTRAILSYALQLTGSAEPAIGFLATASGDAPCFFERFYDTVRPLRCRPSHLPLFARTPDIQQYLAGLHVVLVGGGNTLSMLGAWQAWGLPELLKRAWAHGTVLIGWSAGAICWFESGFSDSHAGRFAAIPCLGFLPGSCCPHYAQDGARKEQFEAAVRAGEIPPGWGIDAGAALHFRGTNACAVLAPADSGGARFVSSDVTDAPGIQIQRIEIPGS